ncbi:hypothetical protein [Ralstonia phage RP31]|uniref:Uncharacterized protein n=2 Tax=Ripduovirus RP12 TaxID=2560700 RepID=A0A1L7N127_9CAUD|nr:hypothetical protein FDH28_gp213 [Ralstonia phage RP12]BAW19182.1 hypothetical protein [Ralstonia phage RP12]BAW19468.1 hypothetical protein [Ralstonia phage RP31]
MMREKMFALLELAGFRTTKACCEGVALKVCSTDQWQGNMDGLFHQIEKSGDTAQLLRDLVGMIDHDVQLTYGAYLSDLSEEAATKLSPLDAKCREAILHLKKLDAMVT